MRRRADRRRTTPPRARRVRDWDTPPAIRRARRSRRTAHARHAGFPARACRARASRDHGRRLVAEFGRARNQRHRADLRSPVRRPAASPRTTIAECGCRTSRAAAARTRHRQARDRPAHCPRPPSRRSADRRPALRCPDRSGRSMPLQIERLAVGPDPRDMRDRPFAQARPRYWRNRNRS